MQLSTPVAFALIASVLILFAGFGTSFAEGAIVSAHDTREIDWHRVQSCWVKRIDTLNGTFERSSSGLEDYFLTLEIIPDFAYRPSVNPEDCGMRRRPPVRIVKYECTREQDRKTLEDLK